MRALAHEVDHAIPFSLLAEDCPDGFWTQWINSPFLESFSYISSVMDVFAEKMRRSIGYVSLYSLLELYSKNIQTYSGLGNREINDKVNDTYPR